MVLRSQFANCTHVGETLEMKPDEVALGCIIEFTSN